MTIPTESYDVLAGAILRMGENAEVLDPPELRARLAATTAAMARAVSIVSAKITLGKPLSRAISVTE